MVTPRTRSGCIGAAYLLLLLTVALIGGLSALIVNAAMNMSRRDAETALLDIGGDFERALLSYRMTTHSGRAARGPASLEDLLSSTAIDGQPLRHLRRIQEDPLTGKSNWGLIRGSDGSIAAIYSLAGGVPIKRVGFAPRGEEWFSNAQTYAGWCFGLSFADPADRFIWRTAKQVGCQMPPTMPRIFGVSSPHVLPI